MTSREIDSLDMYYTFRGKNHPLSPNNLNIIIKTDVIIALQISQLIITAAKSKIF